MNNKSKEPKIIPSQTIIKGWLDKCITEAHIKLAYKKLFEGVKLGKLPYIKEYLLRTVGKPKEDITLEVQGKTIFVRSKPDDNKSSARFVLNQYLKVRPHSFMIIQRDILLFVVDGVVVKHS